MGEGEGEGGRACESIEAEEKSQSGPSRMASNSATISAPYSSLSSFGCRLPRTYLRRAFMSSRTLHRPK